MPADIPKNSAVRELESLRIARADAPKKRSRVVPIAITVVVLAILAGVGYEVYLRTLGRPPEVQTATVSVRTAGQPGSGLPPGPVHGRSRRLPRQARRRAPMRRRG